MAPRVLMFGTGSVGSVYAFLLSRTLPTSNIVTVCRSNFKVAVEEGFTINSTLWGDNLNVKPTVVRSIEEAVQVSQRTPFDYIIICSKALPTTPTTAEAIKSAVSSKTTIVLIQNGIGIEEPYHQLYPQNPILSTVVYLPVTQTSPAVIFHKELELLHVGTYPSVTPSNHKDAAVAFTKLISESGASIELHDDIQFERWSKLLINASWNPICALSRSRDKQILECHPEQLDFIKDVMLEIRAIANACGYAIDTALIDLQLDRAVVRSLPGVEPSMMADALAGRPMEIDAILGNVLKMGREKGIKTPLLRTIYMLAVALDDSFRRTES